jgi:uncharacterized membrane protein
MEEHMANPRSTASIAGHPIHPMLIPFPIAFFVATFVCDLIFWQTGNSMSATAGTWLLGAGLIMAALAAVMGLIDVLGDQQIRQLNDAWIAPAGVPLPVGTGQWFVPRAAVTNRLRRSRAQKSSVRNTIILLEVGCR